MGVAVHHAQDFEAGVFGSALGPQVILGVECVDTRRLLDVATREEAGDARTARLPRHESACFERILGQRQRAHLVVDLGSDLENRACVVHDRHSLKAMTSVARSP